MFFWRKLHLSEEEKKNLNADLELPQHLNWSNVVPRAILKNIPSTDRFRGKFLLDMIRHL